MSGGASPRVALVAMGVSGSGKTTLGVALAKTRGLDFVDGDDLHPPANVAKMRAGHPLDEADRAPWLAEVGRVLADAVAYPAGVVVACSALRRSYRDRLRTAAPGCRFLYLALTPAEAERRVGGRKGHYMPASLVATQFATLEPPGADEVDVMTLDATAPMADLIAEAG